MLNDTLIHSLDEYINKIYGVVVVRHLARGLINNLDFPSHAL